MNCLGLDRGDREGAMRPLLLENSRIRCSMMQTSAQRVLRTLVDQVIFQMEEYQRHSFEIIGLIGINRSPSCGVETTSSDGNEVNGKGVFFSALRDKITRIGMDIPMVGIKDSEPATTAEILKQLLHLE